MVTDAINTVKLSFPAPLIAVPGSVAFDVYRHGVNIARLTSENMNPSTGMFEYIDKDVMNGVYDYFVQTVMIDETQKETGYNVSNVVTEDIEIYLPAATNVRYVSSRVADDQYMVTIAWDAPKDMTEELGFKRYNVFLKGMKAADNREDDGQETTYEMSFGYVGVPSSKVKEITIETVYKYGKSKSAPVVIDLDNPFPPSADDLKVRVVETFGDAMGDTQIDVVSKRDVTYYDKNNNPIRGAVYGRIYGTDEFQISRYNVYEYNEEHCGVTFPLGNEK